MIVRILRFVLPLVVLGAGVAAAWWLYQSRPPLVAEEQVVVPPLVRVMEVARQSLQWRVRTQGTVVPQTEAQIVSEVAARVTWVSPSLTPGDFFEEGEALIRLERRDFELAVVRAQADLARARLRVEQEKAEAEVARREWEEIGSGRATGLTLRIPQLAQVEAELAAAEAGLESARRDLTRTEITAPFAGRVRSENVAVGEFVSRGVTLSRVYAVDYAEVRLPLPDSELAYLDLPLDYRGTRDPRVAPEVVLKSDFGGAAHRWTGRIVRIEGEIDVETRMIFVVARVADPYGFAGVVHSAPLAAGLFVEAEILGRHASGVVVLPRGAIRNQSQVLVVDSEDRLQFREVDIIRSRKEQVVIGAGLEQGERVCISPLDTVVEGMKVRVQPGSV